MTAGVLEPARAGEPARFAEPAPPRRPARSLLSSRVAWVAVGVVVVVALAIGSVHPTAPGESARISRLDSAIKCPSCFNLSIAQSQAPLAVDLRHQVVVWVHHGLSDAQIQHLVVARYGPGVLLVPSGSTVDALLWAIPIVLIGGAAVVLGVYLWRRRRLDVAAT